MLFTNLQTSKQDINSLCFEWNLLISVNFFKNVGVSLAQCHFSLIKLYIHVLVFSPVIHLH